MAVRAFSGTNVLDTATGALSTNTFGTFAAIIKRGGTGSWHTFLALHNSGGSALNQFAYNSADQSALWSNGDTATGPAAMATTTWGLVVVRKASGSATPRFSLYNFTTGTWTHANGSGPIPNWTAPGAGGSVRLRWEGFDHFVGRVAVRAAWNTVRWSADIIGDAALEIAGLEDSLQAWVDASPAALWPFNQASTATAVPDLTGGGANQTTITGTTVVVGDDPPGFSFTLGGGATDLTVAGATQAHTSGAPALTQVHVLTVAGASQAHTAGSPALVQNSDLTVASASQQQTSGNVTLTQVHALAVDASVQQQSADEVELSGEASLAVADALHAQSAGAPTLTQLHELAAHSAGQAQTADQVSLQQTHILAVADAVHGQAADQVVLTVGGSLDIQPATHAQTSSTVTLTQQHTLAVDGSVLAHVAEQAALTQIHALLVAGALQVQLADSLELVAIGEFESPQEGLATVRPYYTIAVVRPATATAVVRSPAATAEVRSTDEAG